MKKVITAIVENEPAQIDKIRELCDRFSKERNLLIEIHPFTNGYDFLEKDTSIYDCVFMDIDMPGINGIDTSNRLRNKDKNISIIFVTNLPQFAIDGYKVQALDFILKPMSYADFSLVMDKLLLLHDRKNETDLFFLIRNEMLWIKPSDILYFEMQNHNINIHLADGKVITYRETVKELEKKLHEHSFYRCNSGIIVNLEHVQSIREDTCTLSGGTMLQVSRSRRNEFMKMMTEHYFKTGL